MSAEQALLALAERDHLRATIDAPLDDPAERLRFLVAKLGLPTPASARVPATEGAIVQYEYLTADDQLPVLADRIKALEQEHFNRTLDAEANGTPQSQQLVTETEERLNALKARETELKAAK